MEEGLKSLFTVVVCEGKQVDACVRERRCCKEQSRGEQIQSTALQMEGEEVCRHGVTVKRKNGEKKWTGSAILEIGPSIFT